MAYPQPSKQTTALGYQPAHAPPTSAAMPSSTGEVLIYDATKMESINVIEAHQSTLGALSVNNAGSLLATASEKGTVIRVFSIPSGDRLYHFRRGSLPSQIYCMTFNSTSSLLSVSSATETIHIFKLAPQSSPFRPGESATSPAVTPSASESAESPSLNRRNRGSSISSAHSDSPGEEDKPASPSETPTRTSAGALASMLRRTSQNVGLSLAQRVGGYLPTSVTEMWEPARDFAWVKIPRPGGNRASTGGGLVNGGSGVKSVVAMSSVHPLLMVVTSEGNVLTYRVDLDKGGEGVLERQSS
jgi:autophagy-related protein 18